MIPMSSASSNNTNVGSLEFSLKSKLTKKALLGYDRQRGQVPTCPQDSCWRHSFGFIPSTFVLTILLIPVSLTKSTGL